MLVYFTQEARILAHDNLAKRLWNGIKPASKRWTIALEQTVAELQGLPQPEEIIAVRQRAWDEIADVHLDGEGKHAYADAVSHRKSLGYPLGQALPSDFRVHTTK
jgi:hypothetical protein